MGSSKSDGTLKITFPKALIVNSIILTLKSYSSTKTPTVSFKTDADSSERSATITSDFQDYPFTYSSGKVSSFSLTVPKSFQTVVSSIGFYGPSAAVNASKVKSFTVSPSSIARLGVGANQQLNVTTSPLRNDVVPSFVSSNPDIVSVSSTGLVTGIKVGSAKISVKIAAQDTSSGAELAQSVDVVVSDAPAYEKQSSRYSQEQLSAASGTPVLPSKGNQKLLVIPVKISNYAANATAANLARLKTTFFGKSEETSWESLASYYNKSSYGALNITGKVTDWFDCGYSTTQIKALTGSGENASYYDPTWTILEKAVAWYKQNNTDIADYDNNKDGILDGVWLVYSAPYYSETNGLGDTFWAYTYWDYDALATNPTAANPVAGNYCWASYNFMNEGYGANGVDAHTYIHETGHLMGLDDYYVASSKDGTKNYGPMGGIDMMDYNIIDHNAYSKFAFGWENPYVVSGACEITLNPASKTGDSILLPTSDGWNGSAFDEYLLLEYYTPTDLNEKDSASAYPGNGVQGFSENGIRIYHVDARMAKMNSSSNFVSYTNDIVSDDSYFTVAAHSNSNAYNVTNIDFRLIQELDCTKKRNFDTGSENGSSIVADNSSLFQNGDSFTFGAYSASFPKKTTMNDATAFPYAIHFGEQTNAGAKITITLA